jgi:hypothetical protein
MKKIKFVFQVALLVAVAMAFMAVLSCESEPGSSVSTYKGSDSEGKDYTLKVTDNSTYVLSINGAEVSTGKVSKSGNTLTLTPNGGGNATVTIDGNRITNFTGSITPDEGGNPIIPGEIIQIQPVAGVWTWTMGDDEATNEWKETDADSDTRQSVFPPGGASRFSNAVIGTENGKTVMKPFEYPAGSQKDIDGNTITTPVFNIKGNTTVSSDNRQANSGARFPQVGWEAVPDAATLQLLRTAYAYQFWIKLNSATANNWCFLTAMTQTGLPIEEGWEYKHYFGNQPGDSGNGERNHFTSGLTAGKWYKIMVVLDKTSPGFNMDQDGYIYQWNNERKRAFEQDKAEKLQWQIPLQHQSGAGVSARSGEPYDILRGSYDFDFDFYGLELLK